MSPGKHQPHPKQCNSRVLTRFCGRIMLFLCLIISILIFIQYCYPSKIFILQNAENVVDLRYVTSSSEEDDHVWNLQMHKVCHCPRAERPLLVPLTLTGGYLESSCSDHATARGSGQKVVSYSFYGTVASRYFNGTEYNANAVKKMYPGWVMRLYHNISMDDPNESKVLCEIWCNNDHLDVCDVHHLPSNLGDQSAIFGMLWRFFVLGDSLVDIFLIRDLDSVIIQREVDAVHHWSNDKEKPTWHIMRDHMYHGVPILGGMWDGRNRNLTLTTELRQKFIARGQQWRKGYDQYLLREIVWPIAQHDMVSHDSYLCKYFYGSQPWPTKRNGTQFVGDIFPWLPPVFTVEICPKECRPQNHQDWFYC